MPATPSTATCAPSGILRVASATPRTIGTPRSRASDAKCDVLPPRLVGRDPGAGPYLGTKSFLAEGHPFEVDESRERFLATNNPRGFLRRV